MKQALVLMIIALAGAQTLPAAPLPLSLLDDHFSVVAEWRTADGQSGSGTPVRLTPETGYFWFFSPTNTEVVVKVLDACSGPAPRFWVFAGGLTDTEVTLTVTDDETGETKIYRNPQGTPFAPIQDTAAFATCDVERCGRGRLADLAASPRARKDLESMASAMTGAVAAPQGVYDRVVADVAAIGRANGVLADMRFQRSVSSHVLFLDLDATAAAAVIAGDYTAWDCLNRRYGLQSASFYGGGVAVMLQFDKVLDMLRVVEDYEALPGVISAVPDYVVGFPVLGPRPIFTSYCGVIEGNFYKYFARLSDGTIYHYTTLPGAPPIAVGSTLNNPEPPWLAEAQACFRAHVDPLS